MNTKLERNIIYSLPLISIIFEITKSFIDSDGLLGVRNYSFLLIIIFFTIKYFKYVIKLNIFLVLWMLYLLVVLIVNRAEFSSFNTFVIVFNAKMLLPLGFVLTSTYKHIQELNKSLLIANILFVLSIISFSLFNVGTNVYGGESGFKVGYFIFGHIYIGSFLIIILPVLFADTKSKIFQFGIALLGALTLIILVLSVRRTSIVIVLIGAMVYVYYFRNYISKIVQYGIAAVLLLVMLFPLYSDALFKQMEARARVFESGAVVKLNEETRLAETIAVWEERVLGHDFKKLMFGQYLFDSAGNYAGGVHKGRPLHLDLNIMLHGAGVIGLLFLILFYLKIYYKYIRIKTKLNLPNEKLLMGAFIGMYLSHLFVLFSGGISTMTFNLMSYLYMGAILGLFRSARMGTLHPKSDTPAYSNEQMTNGVPIPAKVKPIRKPFIYQTHDSK